jgi:hypothetical protein
MPPGTQNYRNLNKSDVVTRTYTLRIQVGRVLASPKYPFGMVIERFTVLTTSG